VRRRVLTVVAAVLLAAVGTLAVLAYVHQANNRAVAGLKTINVVVAQSTVPSGTPAGQAMREGLLGTQKLPVASAPADAVQEITSGLAGLVTSATVQPGQLLLRPMLVAAAQVTGGVAIPKGKIAVTIQLCLPEAVADYVSAGSEVAVFDTYGTTSSSSANLQRTCDAGHQVTDNVATRIVLPRVEVLSVGQAPASSQSSSSGSAATAADGPNSSATQQGVVLVTLAVTQADAQRVISIDETGLPYLGLLTPTSQTGFAPAVPLFQP